MADVASIWSNGQADWAISGPALAADDGLQTAVVLSLFTDRLAELTDLPEGAGRRGWWGDAYADVDGDRIGSRLWLLAREKLSQQTLTKAAGYAREALQWLVDDGVASAVNVQAELQPPERLALQVQIVRSAQPVVIYRFEAFWKGA